MDEYIKLEPFRDEILNDVEYDCDTVNYFLSIVDSQPTADVVEVKHSAWGHKYSLHKIVCLNCGTPRPYQKTKRGYHLAWNSNFCPNCGAKMDLKEGAEK